MLNSNTDTDYGDRTRIAGSKVIDNSASPAHTQKLGDKGTSGQISAFSGRFPVESFIQSSNADGVRVIASDAKFDPNAMAAASIENGPKDATQDKDTVPNPFSKFIEHIN